MSVYYHSASELEFCLRIYYWDEKEDFSDDSQIVVQYRVDCVIIPDKTEIIAVRILILKCMCIHQLHCVLLNSVTDITNKLLQTEDVSFILYISLSVNLLTRDHFNDKEIDILPIKHIVDIV